MLLLLLLLAPAMVCNDHPLSTGHTGVPFRAVTPAFLGRFEAVMG